MRQLGMGTPGGMDALAIFQQPLYKLWKKGLLLKPLARIKIDEKNCFGSLEWPAVRAATKRALPRHHASKCWKHALPSAVEQSGVDLVQKDRGGAG